MSTASPTMTLPTDSDLFILGCITVILSVVFVAMQIWYLKHMRKRKWSLELEFSIPILYLLSVFDIFQLICHLASGVAMVFGTDGDQLPGIFIFGATLTCFWNCGGVCLCYLTYHRCVWMFNVKLAKIIASKYVSMCFLLFPPCYIVFHYYIGLNSYVFFYPPYTMWRVGGTYQPLLRSLTTITNYLLVYFNLPFYAGIAIILLANMRDGNWRTTNVYVIIQLFTVWIFGVGTWLSWSFFNSIKDHYIFCYISSVLLWMIWNVVQPLTAVAQMLFRAYSRRRKLNVVHVSVTTQNSNLNSTRPVSTDD